MFMNSKEQCAVVYTEYTYNKTHIIKMQNIVGSIVGSIVDSI